ASVTIAPGTNTTLQVGASGTTANGPTPVNYQWQKLVSGNFVNIAGATGPAYTTPTLGAPDSGSQYRALVSVPAAQATSSVATVTVGTTPTGPTLRLSQSGGTLTFSWDAGARLQYTASLTPPIIWTDINTGGATTYTVTPSNEFNSLPDAVQEADPIGGRTGTGVVTVTLSNNVLVVDGTYTGLSANRNNIHFHAPGARGVPAGVAYDLATITTGTTSGTISGLVPLTDNKYGGKNIAAQIQDLRNGLWYLNIHSTAFTGGEIRGQVDPGARFYRLISP
ncbi:MAG TPA: CHRD domain-containing protein, partial [Candidatus Limnocylindria bacterium]|nr:CHRD domain-containing protein [Candidatus Limnocylindria bacterium]